MSKTLEELGYEKTEYETQTEYTYDHKIMGERFEHEILFSKPSKYILDSKNFFLILFTLVKVKFQ